MSDPSSTRQANHRIAGWLGLIAVAAFGFGFALVPLYDVLCRVAGLNGKPTDARAQANAPAPAVDRSRRVKVELMATAMPGAGWDFRPKQHEVVVYPGEVVTTTYIVKNPTNVPISGQAVPSVSPTSAAEHLKKLDCFCFQRQELAPGEVREMPVTFFVSPKISERDTSITLSYAFFPLTKSAKAE